MRNVSNEHNAYDVITLSHPNRLRALLNNSTLLFEVNDTDRITKTRLFKYIESFTSKNWKFSEKKKKKKKQQKKKLIFFIFLLKT